MPTETWTSHDVAGKQPVGIIGLGLMGDAFAERLLQAGYPLVVWNRTREKADRWIGQGASWSDHPFRECRRVILSLYSSDIVESVVEGWRGDLQRGQILIDTTTGDPEATLRLVERCSEGGAEYIEAPVSGSSEQTRVGQATILAAGSHEHFLACEDLWGVLGKNVYYVGASGNGSKMKLVSNLVLGLNRAALAEGLVFAELLGIEPSSALEVLRGSAAYSKQMDSKGPKMVEGDYSVQARLSQHLKDVVLMLRSAERMGLELRLTETHRGLLEQAQVDGYGEQDNSAIYASMRHRARPSGHERDV